MQHPMIILPAVLTAQGQGQDLLLIPQGMIITLRWMREKKRGTPSFKSSPIGNVVYSTHETKFLFFYYISLLSSCPFILFWLVALLINLLSILIYFLSYTFPSSLYSVKRYDPPGKLAKLFSNSLSSSRRSSIILSPRERISDLEDTNKNAVQSLLRKSRSSITCALLKAQCAREPPVDEEKKNLKPNDPKGGESKRGSLMSIQSNSTCSTDISRACSKETYDDWLVSDELLDILSGMFMT